MTLFLRISARNASLIDRPGAGDSDGDAVVGRTAASEDLDGAASADLAGAGDDTGAAATGRDVDADDADAARTDGSGAADGADVDGPGMSPSSAIPRARAEDGGDPVAGRGAGRSDPPARDCGTPAMRSSMGVSLRR